MTLTRLPGLRAGACLVALALGGTAVQSGSLVGTWKLVEQNYGQGQANLVESETRPVRLEFFLDAAELRGTIRAGERQADWPRLVDDPARAIHVEEKNVSDGQNHVSVRYRVSPSAGDDLVLEVVEDYRVQADGRTLVGTVEVRFVRGGEDRGSYRLHRRFERQP